MISVSIVAKTITTGILALAASVVLNCQALTGAAAEPDGRDKVEKTTVFTSKIAENEKCLFVIF